MTLTLRTKIELGWTVDSRLTPFTFPAGEAFIKGGEDNTLPVVYQLADLRGADSHELFQLAMWASVCRDREESFSIILPYLPGARDDRGTPGGAVVYAEFLNQLEADRIITLDPHSPLMPGFLKNLTVFPVERIIKRQLGNRGDYYSHPYVGVIAPDKGAVDRAQSAATVLGVPLFKAEKLRDFESGKLSGFSCEPLPKEGKLLIVDDICDGGGTFLGLAEVTGLPRERLDLWVTHGVFSKGLSDLSAAFDQIHTTDSYPSEAVVNTYRPSFLRVHAVLPFLSAELPV